jgi:hypothetical protein
MLRSLINQSVLDDGLGKVKHVNLTAAVPAYRMKVSDSIIIAISDQADGVGIVWLPPVAEAAGRAYYICAPTGAAGGDISVYVKETGTEHATKGDMDADDDHAIFYSDGRQWRVLLNGVA